MREPFQIWELQPRGLSKTRVLAPAFPPLHFSDQGKPSPVTEAPRSPEPLTRPRLQRASPGPPSRVSTPVSRPRASPSLEPPASAATSGRPGSTLPMPRVPPHPRPRPSCSRKQNPSVGAAQRPTRAGARSVRCSRAPGAASEPGGDGGDGGGRGGSGRRLSFVLNR